MEIEAKTGTEAENQSIQEKKKRVLELLKQKGPLLPSALAKEVELPLLITSALLSEIAEERIIKVSWIKVGGSPLYFLSGQEAKLEAFADQLQPKEKEVFKLLAKKRLVEDDSLEPAQRVAIHNLKDFAVAIRAGEKIFWRWHSLPSQAAIEQIKEKLKSRGKEESKKEKAQITQKTRSAKLNELREKVVAYARAKGVKIVQELSTKGKEISALVIISSALGELRFLLVAKDKKSVSESDLMLVHHRGQARKLPVLFLTTGRLTKSAAGYADSLKGYLFLARLQ